jgi:hypothetical protein
MKNETHLTKLADLADPDVHQLVSELCHALNWYPEELETLRFHDFLSLWNQAGGRKISSGSFIIDGVWKIPISKLKPGELYDCLAATVRLRGGSLEQFGNKKILDVVKKLFPGSKLHRITPGRLSKAQLMAQVVMLRRANGDI